MMERVRLNKGIIKCTHIRFILIAKMPLKTGGGGVRPDTVEGGG